MRRACATGHARIGKRLDFLSVADHQEISSLPTSLTSDDTLNGALIKGAIMPGFRPAWTASTSGWQRAQGVALTRRICSTVEQTVWRSRGTANTRLRPYPLHSIWTARPRAAIYTPHRCRPCAARFCCRQPEHVTPMRPSSSGSASGRRSPRPCRGRASRRRDTPPPPSRRRTWPGARRSRSAPR